MKRILFTILILTLVISSACRRGLDYDGSGEPLTLAATSASYSDSSMVASRSGAQMEQLGEMQALWGAATMSASKSASRATESGFQSGDQIGVYLHTTTAVDLANVHTANMLYSTTDLGATWRTSNALTGALSASSYYATAYYPHQSSLVDPHAVSHAVLVDQSAAEGSASGNLEKSDFMSVAGVAVTDPQGLPKATLAFAHRMSKFRVKLIVPTTIDGAAVTGVKSAAIKSLLNNAKIDLATSKVTPSGTAADIKPRLLSGTGAVGTTNTYEAVVVPQAVKGATLVEFICTTASGDRTLSYIVPSTGTITFVGGQRMTLTLVSSSDVAFLGELDLLDGLAKTGEPLTIKVPLGEAWTITSPSAWLTLSTAAAGTYGASVSGTGTGDVQTIYVKVEANDKEISGAWKPREALLSLKSGVAPNQKSTTYNAVQGYYQFEASTKAAITLISDTPLELPSVESNQVWKLKGTLPAWLKITTAPVKWAAANSGNTLAVTALGCDVVGRTKLYAVADPNTLGVLGGTVANALTAAEATITMGTAPLKIYWTHSFKNNGTVWSAGNLVSVNTTAANTAGQGGAKIGLMTDGGLYFKFGSLVGLKGGATGSGVGIAVTTHDKGYWLRPTGHTASTDWASAAYFSDESKTSGDLRDYVTTDNAGGNGIGDACRYYLGSPWRTPTGRELGDLSNQQHATSTNVGWTATGGKEVTTPQYGGWWNGTSASTEALLTAVYFVGAGHRLYNDGSFYLVGEQGGYLSSSVVGVGTIATSFTSSVPNVGAYVIIEGMVERTYGVTLRCVQGIHIEMEAGQLSPVASSAHKVTLRVAGADGDSWTLTESGAGAAAFTPSRTSGVFGTNNSIDLTVAANTTAALRTVTYTLTSGGQTSTLTIEQAPAYVQIGSLKWATGNLVATNTTAPNNAGQGGARIGAPYDGGLYFRFGSLIGTKGGFNGSGVGQAAITHDKGYWLSPTGHTPSADHESVAYFKDVTKNSGDLRDYVTTDNVSSNGIGDACRYYLGSPWRIPTGDELGDLCNKQYSVSTDIGWLASGGKATQAPTTTLYGGWWDGTSSSTTSLLTAVYFVGAGHRDIDGVLYRVGAQGDYCSSSISSVLSPRDFYFDGAHVYPNYSDGNFYWFPLRCVQGMSMALSSEMYSPVASSAHKFKLRLTGAVGDSWTLAKSGAGAASFTPSVTSGKFGTNTSVEISVAANTAATMRTVTFTLTSGGSTCDLTIEQAPGYVQIGSLKWATGNLVATNTTAPNNAGQGGARIGAPYDGGLYFKFGSLIGIKGGFDGSGVGQAVNSHSTDYWLRPTGHTASTDWASAAYFSDNTKTTGDFKTYHPTDNAGNDGIGDACRYYLGEPWRLPTIQDLSDLCNKQYAIGTKFGWAATGGKETSPTTTPSTLLYGGWWNGTSSSTTSLLTAVYFVGAGYRTYDYGALTEVGRRGVYGSSSIGSGIFLIHLDFTAEAVWPQDNDHRSYSFTVRCVQ